MNTKKLVSAAGILAVVIGMAFFMSSANNTPVKASPTNRVNPSPSQTAAVTTHAPDMSKESLDTRIRLYREWLDAGATVAERAHNVQLAQEVNSFLIQRSMLNIPFTSIDPPSGRQVGGLRPIRDQHPAYVRVIPFMEQDLSMEYWNNYLKGPFSAAFQPNWGGIVIRGYAKTSKTWKGVLMLHEGLHAYRYITKPYNWKDQKTFCFKEREAHAMQNEICLAIGGSEYRVALQNRIQHIVRECKAKGRDVKRSFLDRGPYDKRLDRAFGPALSDIEKASRGSSLNIHAHFELAAQHFPEKDVAEKQALVLWTLYKGGGVFNGPK